MRDENRTNFFASQTSRDAERTRSTVRAGRFKNAANVANSVDSANAVDAANVAVVSNAASCADAADAPNAASCENVERFAVRRVRTGGAFDRDARIGGNNAAARRNSTDAFAQTETKRMTPPPFRSCRFFEFYRVELERVDSSF